MARIFMKRAVLALRLGTSAMVLTACDGVSVGVGYGYDPFYDSMLWNDYYRNVNVDIDVDPPERPDRPDRPVKPTPPIAKPPVARPPTARPPTARPPIHRPSTRPAGGRRR